VPEAGEASSASTRRAAGDAPNQAFFKRNAVTLLAAEELVAKKLIGNAGAGADAVARVAALQAVSGGGLYIDKSLQTLFRRGHEHGSPIEPLSPRELEVLALVAKGKSNIQIGERLYVSADTVKTHLSHVMRKLQASDRTHAAVLGLRWGLIDWPETEVAR
jgi:DNA-binding NarL/FixJ family response regulator